MPAAVPFVVSALASAAGATAVQAAVVALAASVAVGMYESDRAAEKARQAWNDAQQDRKLTINSAVAARRVVVGRTAAPTVRAYADTVGTNKRLFDQALVFSDDPIDAVEGIYLNDYYLPATNIVDGLPTTGKYLQKPVPVSKVYRATLGTSTSTITLPDAPIDKTTTLVTAGSGDSYSTVAVSSVSGNDVLLAAAVSGPVAVEYQTYDTENPLRVQWVLGDQTAATTWAGVSTPNQGASDVRNGVAYIRTLMGWDENIYQSGPPTVTPVVRGARMVYDPRKNRCPTADLSGFSVGGAVPSSMTINAPSGMAFSIAGCGDDRKVGLPYIDVRCNGTASASGQLRIVFQTATNAPTAAAGQTWTGRAYVKRTASPGAGPTGLQLRMCSYDSANSRSNETLGAAITWAQASTMSTLEVTDAALLSGAVRAGLMLDCTVSSGTTYDFTVRVYLPQAFVGNPGDSTDCYGYTANPALLAAWWRLRPRSKAGMGTPWSLIDWSTVVTAASICDETISVRKRDGSAGYESIRRYACNAVLYLDKDPASNLSIILRAMAGVFPFTAGKYRLFAGAHRTPEITITDADVAPGRPISIAPSTSGVDVVPNTITARISDSFQQFTETSAKAVQNATYLAADGGEESVEIDLPSTTDERQANYLMGCELEIRRPTMVAELTVCGLGADRALMDAVQLDLSGYEAFDAMTWEVRSRKNNFDGTYTLKLAQTKSWRWALDADSYTPTNPPTPPDLDYLWQVTKLSSLSASSALRYLPDGTSMALVVLSWPQHAQEYVRQSGKIEIRWRSVEVDSWAGPTEADGDATEKQFDIRARKGQRFIFQARARNGVGSVGPWVTTYMDAGSVAKPVNVASLTATIIYGAVLIRYAGVTSPFHAYTEFREGVDWDTGTPLGGAGQPTRSTGSYFVWPWPTYGSHTIWAKHFDSTGQESVTERSVTVTVDDRIKLGSVGIDVNLAGINLCPNSSFEIDRDSSGVADGWNAYQAGTTGTVARTVPSLGRVRGKCQQITASALGTADTDRVGVWRDITVSPGAIQKAIASVYVWGTFGRQGVVVVEARQGSTVLDSKTASITTSGSWKRIAASFTAFPADCDTVRVYLWMSSGAGSAVTFRVDDVVFEEADVPSAWHPSPWDELLGTDGIADGAATIVVDSYSPGPDNYTGTSTVHLVQASTITNDDTVARQVIVTGQLTLTFPNGIAAANEIYAWLGKTTDANFGSNVYADWRHVVAAGEDKNYSITITSTRTIPAGATETYWIGVWISNFTSPARYYAERVRAELVKR